jgi:hypothetical protein
MPIQQERPEYQKQALDFLESYDLEVHGDVDSYYDDDGRPLATIIKYTIRTFYDPSVGIFTNYYDQWFDTENELLEWVIVNQDKVVDWLKELGYELD